MIAQPQKYHHPLVMLLRMFLLAFLWAAAFVVVMTYTLPSSDGAYGQNPFADDLVFPIMSLYAAGGALIAFPFYYFSLRALPWLKSTTILAITVLCAIILLTPIHPILGFFGSIFGFFSGVVIARRSGLQSAGKTH